MNAKPIVVFDTQIVLRAAINPRSLPAKLFYELGSHYILPLSAPIRAEIFDVLHRPKLREKFSTLTDEVVQRALSVLDAGQQIQLAEVLALSRDPKDDIFLATAMQSKAGYLVSEDQDLLVLHPYGEIHILNALDFLRVLQPQE